MSARSNWTIEDTDIEGCSWHSFKQISSRAALGRGSSSAPSVTQIEDTSGLEGPRGAGGSGSRSERRHISTLEASDGAVVGIIKQGMARFLEMGALASLAGTKQSGAGDAYTNSL